MGKAYVGPETKVKSKVAASAVRGTLGNLLKVQVCGKYRQDKCYGFHVSGMRMRRPIDRGSNSGLLVRLGCQHQWRGWTRLAG